MHPRDVSDLWTALAVPYGKASLNMLRSHLGMAFSYGILHGYCMGNPVGASVFPEGGVRPPQDLEWLDAEKKKKKTNTSGLGEAGGCRAAGDLAVWSAAGRGAGIADGMRSTSTGGRSR